jgi:hypothetical protein
MIDRYAILASALLASGSLLAQPTLDANNNVPAAGSEYPISIGTYLFPGPTGPNQVYGFWDLVGTGNRNISYVAPSATPTSAQVPGVDLLSTDGGTDTLFLGISSTGQEVLAELTGLGLVKYTDPLLELKYPCTFGTTWSDDASASYTVSGFAVTRTGTISGIGDGYGTLELPAVVIPNVLRVTVTRRLFDQSPVVNVRRNSVVTYYFSEAVRHPVLRLSLDTVIIGTGAPAVTYDARWMYGDGEVSVQSIDPSTVRFTAYPNPANGAVNLSFGDTDHGTRTLELMDATGRIVRQQPLLQQHSAEVLSAFNTAGLAPGVYHLRLIGENSVLGTQRLVVQ